MRDSLANDTTVVHNRPLFEIIEDATTKAPIASDAARSYRK